MKGGGGRGGGGGGPSRTTTITAITPELIAGVIDKLAEQEELERNRGYLQHDMVRLWNRCARCEHDAHYHRPFPRLNDRLWNRHDPSAVCEPFLPRPLDEYLRVIVMWERKRGALYTEVEPEGVIIPNLQRRPTSENERELAVSLAFDFDEVDRMRELAEKSGRGSA